MSVQPWEEWTLDSEFFAALNAWNRAHPETKLDRILQNFTAKLELSKPFLEAIPDGPLPIRGLIKALVQLIQLSGTFSSKRKELKNFIDDILGWVEGVSQTFQDGLPGKFTENTWKDLASVRDLINEACQWAAQEMRTPGKIRARVRLLSIDEQIGEFRKRWDTIHLRFSGISAIRSAQGNDAIIKEIKELPFGPALEKMQGDIDVIRQRIMEMASAETNLSSLSIEIPPRPAILHGRESIINSVLETILTHVRGNESANIALMGAGGIGKTTVALAVINHEEILEEFGALRHWIPCDQVPNTSLLLQCISRSLRVSTSSGDLWKEIIAYLKKDSRPRLVLVDNFESFWDKKETRAWGEGILQQLASFAHISLLMTMRGTIRPSQIRWKLAGSIPAVIPALSPAAARATFEEISPYVDDYLDDLLRELDHVPLAVTLVAKIGESGLYPRELLDQWRTSGTTFLSLHPDRNNSVDVSICFSLQSTRISSNPGALRLLSILSLLPGGIRYGNMNQVAPLLSRSWEAEVTLLSTSLAYRGANRCLQVLSPIRSHVATIYPPTHEDLDALFTFYYALAELGKDDPGSKSFNDNIQSITLEESNVRSTLMKALETRTPLEAIKASLCFLNYQFWSSPSTEIVQQVVDVVRVHVEENTRSLLPLCLLWQGKLYDRTSNPALALESLEEAERKFFEQGDRKSAGESAYTAGHVLRIEVESERALEKFEKAVEHFQAISYLQGLARCYCSQGLVNFNHHRNDEALQLLKKAQDIAEKMQDIPLLMKCLSTAGHILRGIRPYEAIQFLTTAREHYLAFGPRYHADICMYHIGIAYTSLHKYKEAYNAYEQAYKGFREGRNYDQTGFCLFHWAETKRQEGQLQDSVALFRRAELHWKEKGNVLQQTFCMRGQARIMVELGEVVHLRSLGERAVRLLEKSGKHPHYVLLARLEVEAGVMRARVNGVRGRGPWWFTDGSCQTLSSFLDFLFPVFRRACHRICENFP